MVKYSFSLFLILLVSQLLGACDSSNTEADSGVPDAADGPQDDQSDAAVNDAEKPDADETEEEAFCGDMIVQEDLNEICDDGNLNDNDGCTSLCEYSCVDDSDCDDLNSCNGTETCNDEHYCDFGDFLEDGVECENQKSCYTGLCVPDVCGDKRRQGDEECDDGDTLNDNGCTTDCEYTCTSDEECTEGDTCAGSRTCDLDEHTCTGSPKEDKSSCSMLGSGDPGWCIKGVCVPDKCGNGDVDGDEQCDEGLKNGDPGSTCTLFCETTICGNGIIEPGEQCDDNNTSDLDGCNANCQAEVWIRWTTMNLLKDPSPEWCVHKGKNQFSNAFPGAVRDSGSGFEIDVLGIINGMLNGALDDCGSNVINLFAESSDISFQTSDDEVYLSVFEGGLEEDETCESPMDVDTRFFVVQPENQSLDATVLKTKTAQRPGVIKTLVPEDIISRVPGMGSIKLHDLMMLIEVDTESISAPKSPPEMDQSVEIPERLGFNDEDPADPAGRLCGAVSADSMANQGVDRESRLAYCCQSDGSPYTECFEGDVPGEDCDTFLDVMKNGCRICDPIAALAGEEPNCDTTTCDRIGLDIIYAVPPDVDTDDDEVADAYSILIGIEGIRVRATGVREAPEE